MFWTQSEPMIMGILNVTPDSFYDGGKYAHVEKAKARALQMIEEGVDIIDVGGESTRPGATPVLLQEEIDRVCPVVEAIRKESDIPISLDTYKSAVVKHALKAGPIEMINDVTALRGDPEMAQQVIAAGADVVLMHMRGTPQTMQQGPTYVDLIQELLVFFHEQVRFALSKGIGKDKIWIDPGIGFGKKLEHNLEIFKRLDALKALHLPILIAPSRKSFIGDCLGNVTADRSWGTAAAIAIAVGKGARGVRVHDVKEMKQVVQVALFLVE